MKITIKKSLLNAAFLIPIIFLFSVLITAGDFPGSLRVGSNYTTNNSIIQMDIDGDKFCGDTCNSYITITFLQDATEKFMNELNTTLEFKNAKLERGTILSGYGGACLTQEVCYEVQNYYGKNCTEKIDPASSISETTCNDLKEPVDKLGLPRKGDKLNFVLTGYKNHSDNMKWGIYMGGLYIDPIWNGTVVGEYQDTAAPYSIENPYHVLLVGDLAFTDSDADRGITVLNISNLSNIVGVGWYTDTVPPYSVDGPRGFYVNGSYAYSTCHNDDEFTILNISDITNITGLGGYQKSDPPYSVDIGSGQTSLRGFDIEGDMAYIVSTVDDGITILNISDKTNPVAVGWLNNSNTLYSLDGANAIDVIGDLAYIVSATDDGVTVLNISNPADITNVSWYSDATPPCSVDGPIDIFIQGNYAYVTSQVDSGLAIINITDPTNINCTGSVYNNLDPYSMHLADQVFVEGDYAYVTNSNATSGGLTIINISDKTNPTIINGTKDYDGACTMGNSRGIYYKNNYAYLVSQVTDCFFAVKVWEEEGAGAVDTNYTSFINYYDNNGTLNETGIAFFNVTIIGSNGSAYLTINGTKFDATNWTDTLFNVSLTMANGTYEYNWTSWSNGFNHNQNISANRYYTVNATAAAKSYSYNITQSLSISKIAGRIASLSRGLYQSFSLTSIVNKFVNFATKNIYQSFSINSISSRSALFIIAIKQAFSITSLVSRTGQFGRNIYQGIIIFTIPTIPGADNNYPIFSNYWDNNGTIAGNGIANFNVNVTNTNGTVLLQINNTNYSASFNIINLYTGINFTVDTILPQVVTMNNTNFFVSDAGGTLIKYTINGTYLENYTLYEENKAIGGLTMNETNFHTTDVVDDVVYIYTINGTYVKNFSLNDGNHGNGASYGLTMNETNFFVSDLIDDVVYIYTINGTYKGYNFSLFNSNNNNYGLTMNETNFLTSSVDSGEGVKGWAFLYTNNGTYIKNYSLNDNNKDSYGIVMNETNFFTIDKIQYLIFKYRLSTSGNYYNASVNLSTGVYPYQWISWGNGTNHNQNISATRYYTVNASTGADSYNYDITQSLSISKITGRIAQLSRTLFQQFNFNSIVSRTAGLNRNIQQIFSIDSLVTRTASFSKNIQQSLTIDSIANRIAQLSRTIYQGIIIYDRPSASVITAADTEYPDITILYPQHGGSYTELNLSLNVSTTATDVSAWWYVLDDAFGCDGLTYNFTPNITFTALEGANYLCVYLNDTSNNINSSNIAFWVDTSLDYNRSITQPLIATGIVSRLGRLSRNIFQDIKLFVITKTSILGESYENIFQAIRIDSAVTRTGKLSRNIYQFMSIDSIINRFANMGIKNIMQPLEINSFGDRIALLGRDIIQPIKIDLITAKISSFPRNIYQEIKIMSISNKVNNFVSKDIVQSFSIDSFSKRILNAYRWINQLIKFLQKVIATGGEIAIKFSSHVFKIYPNAGDVPYVKLNETMTFK